MMKIYTNQEVSKELQASPKESVIKNLLNFSKAYEALKSNKVEDLNSNKIGVILN